MKFRDPKTGEVFEDIERVYARFCQKQLCGKCALDDHTSLLDCREFYRDNPAEAARLMGYEVVEDSATSETQGGKPHICQVLGVEVDERFSVESESRQLYEDAYISGDGIVRTRSITPMDAMRLCQVINGELRIIRKPRFTEEEVADAKAILRFFPNADHICRDASGMLRINTPGGFMITGIFHKLFPSLRPGQSIALADIARELS